MKIAFATGDMFMHAYEPISLDAVLTEIFSWTTKWYFKITKVYIQLHDCVVTVIFCKMLMIYIEVSAWSDSEYITDSEMSVGM